MSTSDRLGTDRAGYYAAATAEEEAAGGFPVFEPEAPLLLPHRTLTVSPSISSPFAHA